MSKQIWDERFFEMAKLVSSWSKDTNTQVGCVVVGPDREVRAVGYNGFPRGVDDSEQTRFERPLKYLWTECAERNAIYNSSLVGISLKGSTIYINGGHGFPCTDCARAIVQCGIKTLVGREPNMKLRRYAKEYRETIKMFQETGVAWRYIKN